MADESCGERAVPAQCDQADVDALRARVAELEEELNRLRYVAARVGVQSVNACCAMGAHHPAGLVGMALREIRAALAASEAAR